MSVSSFSRRGLLVGAAGLGRVMLVGHASALAVTPSPLARERFIEGNGVSLRTQAFGDPSDPALLLVLGATAPMRFWQDAFCVRLAEAGRFVIRYDNRDTGRSTSFPPGAPGYTIRDMAGDAAAVLDAYGIERAHVAGWSLGGMIAQHVAIYYPQRVRSLFLYSTSLDATGVGNAASGAGQNSGALPLPPPATFELMAYLAQVDWRNRDAAIEGWTRELLTLTGSGDPQEPAAVREVVEVVVDEARDVVAHRLNHPIVVATSPSWRASLGAIAAPTMVMHGTDDGALPPEHGRALAREIPGARLVEVEGMGHVLAPHSRYWGVLADALIAHTQA
jgi:pimeloyl-ACP methyl ester carboxylesterase